MQENVIDGLGDKPTIRYIFKKWDEISTLYNQRDYKHPNPFPDGIFRIFWYDIILERKQNHQHLHLIGKSYDPTKRTFVNTCVTITNLQQKFYLLLPKDQQVQDVLEEFTYAYAPNFGIKQFEWRRVVKKYAFEPKIDFLSDYVEIKAKSLNDNLRNVQGFTFDKILATKMNFIEGFFLERRIKGPGWLDVRNFDVSKVKRTNCSIELTCDSNTVNESCRRVEIPRFSVCVINIKTIFNDWTKVDEIVLVGCVFQREFDLNDPEIRLNHHYCIVQPACRSIPLEFTGEMVGDCKTKVFRRDSEKGLLKLFIHTIHQLNPDIVVSHDLAGNDTEVLYSRIVKHKIRTAENLSRLRYGSKFDTLNKSDLFRGRLRLGLKSLLPEMVKSTTYSMRELVKDILDVPFVEVHENLVANSFKNVERFVETIVLTMWENFCAFQITVKLHLLQFSMEITKLCGNYWNLTLNGNISDRCEFLLSHEFNDENYILPNKKFGNYSTLRRDCGSYRGGLVLPPKMGLYDCFVVSLDFNSLYPNIIREFNLCFSTFLRDKDGDRIYEKGVLPQLMSKLLDLREQKNRNPNDETKAAVLKKITNSIYGYLSYRNSRFFSRSIAEEITKKGREILTRTVEIINGQGYEIIYGDTDSVMFTVPELKYERVLEVAKGIIETINSGYTFVNLDLSAVYKPFIVFNKKKYAGYEYYEENGGVERKTVFKGLEIVRRDWSVVGRNAGERILTQILENPNVSVDEIYKTIDDIKRGLVGLDVDDFAISQRLMSDLDSYKSKLYPHISVASSEFCLKHKKFKRNDFVTYVVTEDLSDRFRHIDEAKLKNLPIDFNYYVSNQIFPVINRILFVLKDYDETKLKQILFVTNTNTNKPRRIEEVPKNNKTIGLSRTSDFMNGCSNCKRSFEHKSNHLVLTLRNLVQTYRNSSFVCENRSCKFTTTYVSLDVRDPHFPLCPRCETNRLEGSEFGALKKILNDLSLALRNNEDPELVNIVKSFSNTYCRYVVNLNDLFEKLVP